ncbi:MAG: hypothetical protein ACREOQ_19630, partial [Gemmatimonadales bacterium]
MTFKHKLSRRLAIARELALVPGLVLLVACSDEATGPDTGLPQFNEVTKVIPASATIETNQKIRFRTETARGREVVTTLTWKSSGGSITAAGVFSASSPGIYKVVGRGRGRQKADTSTVIVVPAPTDVVGIKVSPGDVSVDVGTSKTFVASALLSDGTTSAVGVSWRATGGSIDAGGVYKAGGSSGKFKVIATGTSSDLADTAIVNITAPEPTLAQVIIKPASYSLATGTTKQFNAFGRNSLGDSVAVQVSFSASGGSVSPSGLYTAGNTAGSYRVIVSSSGLADTAALTLTGPAPAPAPAPAPTPAPDPTPTPTPTSGSGATGLPFGLSQQLTTWSTPQSPMTMTADGYSSSTVVNRISAARAGRYKLILNLTGGRHSDYMSVINGVMQFDESKWRAKMDTYNTSTIRQAIAQGVYDGTIVGSNVMDEPYVSGGADGGGNTWGPKGTMTKAKVDRLCSYVKQMFPTLAAGVAHQHNVFEPDRSYAVCDFTIDQYDARRGDVRTFLNDGLAMAQRDHMSIMFGINVLDGGVQDRDGNYSCDGPGQGGKGTFAPNCRMTPEQVRDWGLLLGKAGCGLYMWRADEAFMASSGNQLSLRDLAA